MTAWVQVIHGVFAACAVGGVACLVAGLVFEVLTILAPEETRSDHV